MMIIDLLSDICLLLGGIFTLTGAVGLLRLPDFYTRLHAASVTESLAAPLLIVGIILDTGFTLDSGKLILIIVIMVVSNPTITHALCRAAVHGGNTPEMESKSTQENQLKTETELSSKELK
jgi:multicomponent Na+:H+ antiporter subunit G